MRRRSPSYSNNNFEVPTNNTCLNNNKSNQQSNDGTDDLNSNEPNDPDDSRLTPTIKSAKIKDTSSYIDIPKTKKSNHVSTNATTNLALDMDISVAKAFGASKPRFPIASSTLPLTVTDATNISSKIPTSSISSSSSSYSYLSSSSSTSMSSSPSFSRTKLSILSTKSNKRSRPVFIERYPNDSTDRDGINIDDMIDKLINLNDTSRFKQKQKSIPFHSWEIQLICSTVREIFMGQPNLLRLQAPIKIVGDIHGQFNDLLRILKLSGWPNDTNYLFLGDYVDRGKQSLETILLLFCFKIKYPNNFFMLRGNHESANITKMYGFYDECKRRKNTKIWKSFIDVFNCLPIAATIQDKIFAVHGGISPDLMDLKQISKGILRPTDIPDSGLLTDLLWSDPDTSVSNWSLNDRGVSYTFSKKNVLDFCNQFNFDLIIRGHMVVEDGYEFFAKKKLVTVFSAPNYCGQFENWGAVLSINTGLICSFELLKPHSLKKNQDNFLDMLF
ncbi:hypothetical protein KAFR_0G03660 [Kazachstania africana CBS 2517]|uniref:Serine/threonine-protein phosphatase n=1 Tax=Kazachstania africana (strain ATCC 22294 / BCRC 22015 / CBS 2517 / CECT 1963 / NBRC 1671 / NRRL Y-8276) TaxID=1071382 RepID=H2AYE8_KAZAF|nr:hypothetical protein KAFR_0G03660 [Kazachstania africana CBS 2517]CCF59398.1 hypothetical protein KAFR_0G03660 [Kazachstania africana CBS 2517]